MATYLDDQLTGAAASLLTNHTADSGATWTLLSGTPATDSPQLTGTGRLYKPQGVGPIAQAMGTAFASADYQVDAYLSIQSLLAADSFTVYGRMGSSTSLYFAVLTQDGALALKKNVGGVVATLGSATVALTAGATPKLTLKMVGSALTVLWNDVSVITATDGAITASGHAGVKIGGASSTNQTTTTGIQLERIIALDPVTNAPANVSAPTITGQPYAGQTLTETGDTWANNPTSFSRQWQKDGADIAGATGVTYVPGTGDVGHAIRVGMTATNAAGTSAPVVYSSPVTIQSTPPLVLDFYLTGGPGNTVNGASLGGAPGAGNDVTQVFDDVAGIEGRDGMHDHRCVVAHNPNPVSVATGTAVWLSATPYRLASDGITRSPGVTTVEVAVATEGVGVPPATIPNEAATPSDITSWSTPTTGGAALVVGNLPPDGWRAFWIRWTVPPGSNPAGTPVTEYVDLEFDATPT
jgi:hypothetical protein